MRLSKITLPLLGTNSAASPIKSTPVNNQPCIAGHDNECAAH